MTAKRPRHNVSGNGSDGIRIASTGNTISTNLIGLGADRSLNVGNSGAGIIVNNSANALNFNRIFLNHGAGVRVQGGVGNSVCNNDIARNSGNGIQVDDPAKGTNIGNNMIYSNEGLGINLGPPGVTPNDPGDADAGANTCKTFRY